MKNVLFPLFFLALLTCSNAENNVCEPQKETSLILSEDEKKFISQAEIDGRLMYEKDIRAAYATDLLLEKIKPSDYPNFVGWVTYPNDNDFTVTFYESEGTTFSVIADVIYSPTERPTLVLEPARKPTEKEVSMIKARIAALDSGTNSCAQRFNSIVIPSLNNDAWDVYLIAATTDPKKVQVGGHIKVQVSKNSSQVLDRITLSKTCLSLNKSDEKTKDGEIVGLYFSHIISPLPMAIHTYLNNLHKIYMSIVTDRGIWSIRKGKLTLLNAKCDKN